LRDESGEREPLEDRVGELVKAHPEDGAQLGTALRFEAIMTVHRAHLVVPADEPHTLRIADLQR
jgi:hypothetical protein